MDNDVRRSGQDAPPGEPAVPAIDAGLVRRLVAEQFPQWARLPVRAVQFDGHDNRTFHLGDSLAVRLPSAVGYAAQVEKEQRWLPVLAPQLPLPVPVPVAQGRPGAGYPFNWSVMRWLEGDTAANGHIEDLTGFATDLARFLSSLQRADTADGPLAGEHSAFRGASLRTYDEETRRALAALRDRIPVETATAVWEEALEATWLGRPVWFHGDVAVGNLLVRDGRLSAVLDFGCSGVGDPSCDTTIAWTLLHGESRRAFRDVLGVDGATWARGRGWTLWKALITLAAPDSAHTEGARRSLANVLDDFEHEHEGEPRG
ncbi:Predicted kinase, aminoglycoside phosphotransferase (APT) family [Streptomyces sp. WMMB 714]|uniref:aminoglycoside phosphotransferase family protein n=1 Tax=Streptomyces sp. WMMB 714 TaxID=1286822 RepID=UPI000823AA9A|nr:aminoglycoside phosphotransferase family protein [Streptomyces sp. WMMB 714]SCK19990.1 Predicted kinase, aminoglycoside phosphotransferase (APT) family [Streptomyces sp. WMMB 714]